jgi:hypothetical protein
MDCVLLSRARSARKDCSKKAGAVRNRVNCPTERSEVSPFQESKAQRGKGDSSRWIVCFLVELRALGRTDQKG